MDEKFTITQQQRLTELNFPEEELNRTFESREDRDKAFKELEKEGVKHHRLHLEALLGIRHQTLAVESEKQMEGWLMGEGFTRVATPAIITRPMLERMTITRDHPLTDQVFWLDDKRCLRPMLAPNLYEVMRDLHRITRGPVRIFEAGSCFRKESQGAQHLNEFTMLNLVELDGVAEGQQMDRLRQLAAGAMEALGIADYQLVEEESEVYGTTLDIEVEGVEIASGAFGPHFLDEKWGIFQPWVGIGFGIERIAMIKGGYRTIKRVGKSISFLDGSPLHL